MHTCITIKLFGLALFCLATIFPAAAEEIIVRFSASPQLQTIQRADSESYASTDPAIQKVLTLIQPRQIRPLFTATVSLLPAQLRNIQLWRLAEKGAAALALKALRNLPTVVYAETNDAMRTHSQPNDPLLDKQWYLQNIRAPELWTETLGDANIIIGVIDTGIDYLHEDLRHAIWINRAEDINGNGVLDSLDLNQIDDDGNGYVDDVIGWDFTDAPGFADGGDYLDPDNDPMDAFGSGHGTPIAGIIAAAQNNAAGISGVAPGLTVMNLRAGTASGFLEEDDVAEAILYAVNNGCKIVNMSFGDAAFSYLLRDAIEYGANRGVLFVASSGNSGNSDPNYPAAFAQTISVGASDSTDQLAGFSSYGSSLNIVAPGQGILSTLIGNRYGNTSGTSFAAPLVSAALGLIGTVRPDASPAELTGALYAGCRDRGFAGWDPFYGHGLLDLPRSARSIKSGFAEIISPAPENGIHQNEIAVIGTAFSPAITSYTLSYGAGETPISMTPIAEVPQRQALRDTLAMWNISALPDTTYTLELRLRQTGFNDVIARNRIYIDRTPPVSKTLGWLPVIVKDQNSWLIRLSTDDATAATLRYRSVGESLFSEALFSRYFRRSHDFILSTGQVTGELEWQVELENAASLTAVIDDNGLPFRLSLPPLILDENLLTHKETLSFNGFLMQGSSDFTMDGIPEAVFSELVDGEQFGRIIAGTRTSAGWDFTHLTENAAIPRDVAAIHSGDGMQLIAGFGNNSLLLGGNLPGEYPGTILWEDTTNFWASRLQNYDDDPEPELLGLNFGRWKIFDIHQDFSLTALQTLESATAGNNQFGVPWSVQADFDNDGKKEIVLEDLDGDVYVYEANDAGQYQLIWSQRMDGSGGSSLLQAADIDGDGVPELISAVRNQPPVLRESNINTQYWVLTVWKSAANNDFVEMARLNTLGVNVQSGIFNGLAAGDIDGDGRSEILFTPFPRAYLLAWENAALTVKWHRDGINSNTAILADFNGDGRSDVVMNQPEGLSLWELPGPANQPLPPPGLTATPLDTTRIRLDWQTVPAQRYRVYRSDHPQGPFLQRDSTTATIFQDSMLENGKHYYYTVTSINSDFPLPESRFSRIAGAAPNAPPRVLSVQPLPPRQLQIRYSEAMGESAFETSVYRVMPLDITPASVIRSKNRGEALLSFRDPLPGGENELRINNIRDAQRTPLSTDSIRIPFVFPQPSETFYLERVELHGKTRLRLRFNRRVDRQSAAESTRYTLLPDGEILSAKADSTDARWVELQITPRNRLGSLGVIYEVQVSGLRSENGIGLASDGRKLAVNSTPENLDALIVYPNPYRRDTAVQPLRFANVPEGCTIRIFSASGQLLRQLDDRPVAGSVEWDLKTRLGDAAGSGVYIYVARWKTQEVRGKLLIIQ